MEMNLCGQNHDTSCTADDTVTGLTVLEDNIFKVAYDDDGKKRATDEAQPSGAGFYLMAIRLLCDMFSLTPALLISYYFFTLWESIEPALKLYLSVSLFAFVRMNRDHCWMWLTMSD